MEESTTKKAAFDLANLAPSRISGEFTDRALAMQMAQLAIELARQAGEEVRRPLASHQIARALDVNIQEWNLMLQHMTARWARLRDAGQLSGYREPEPPHEPGSAA